MWGSPHVQRKTRPSDWSPLVVTHPLSSAAQRALPTVPYSADELVPGHREKTDSTTNSYALGSSLRVKTISRKKKKKTSGLKEETGILMHLRSHAGVPADVVANPKLQVT